MSHLQVVNGQVCFNCTDVARALQDQNPAKTQEANLLGVDPSRILPDGQVKPKQGDYGTGPTSGINQPLSTGDKGRAVNVLA